MHELSTELGNVRGPNAPRSALGPSSWLLSTPCKSDGSFLFCRFGGVSNLTFSQTNEGVPKTTQMTMHPLIRKPIYSTTQQYLPFDRRSSQDSLSLASFCIGGGHQLHLHEAQQWHPGQPRTVEEGSTFFNKEDTDGNATDCELVATQGVAEPQGRFQVELLKIKIWIQTLQVIG